MALKKIWCVWEESVLFEMRWKAPPPHQRKVVGWARLLWEREKGGFFLRKLSYDEEGGRRRLS